MSWNYRVLRDPHGDGTDCPLYSVHECHYDETGKITGWTTDPVGCMGCDLEELRRDLQLQLQALSAPVLEVQRVNGQECLAEIEDVPHQ